jgi:hypothetical protein
MTTDAERLARLEAELGKLRDKEAIRAGVVLYARSIDRADPETVCAIWHDDGVYEHFQNGIEQFASAAERGADRADKADMLKDKTLIVSNISIELDGDVAFVESYGISLNTLEVGAETIQYVRTLRWLDRWERRDGATWKLAYKLCLHGGWDRWEPAAPAPVFTDLDPESFGKRSRADWVFNMPARLRVDSARFGVR